MVLSDLKNSLDLLNCYIKCFLLCPHGFVFSDSFEIFYFTTLKNLYICISVLIIPKVHIVSLECAEKLLPQIPVAKLRRSNPVYYLTQRYKVTKIEFQFSFHKYCLITVVYYHLVLEEGEVF